MKQMVQIDLNIELNKLQSLFCNILGFEGRGQGLEGPHFYMES